MKYEEWLKVGSMCKQIYNSLSDEMKNYNKSAKEFSWLKSAMKFNTKMRDKLDNLIFQQHPEKTTEELAKVFFGSTSEIATNTAKEGEQ